MESYPTWEARRQATFADMGEYQEGTILEVDFWHSGMADGTITPVLPDGFSEGPISLEIVRAFPDGEDAVRCLVRQVSPDRGSSPDQVYLLRLFDRRYAGLYRRSGWYGLGPWTRHREKRYQQYLIECAGKDSEDFVVKEGTWESYCERVDRSRALQRFAGDLGSGTLAQEGATSDQYEDIATIEDDFAGLAEAYSEWQTQGGAESELEILKTLHERCPDVPTPRWIGRISYASPFGDINGVLIEYIPNAITVRQYLRATVPCGEYDDRIARVCNEASIFQSHFAKAWPILFRGMSSDVVLVQLNTPLDPKLSEDRISANGTGDGALSRALRVASPLAFYIVRFNKDRGARLRRDDESDDEWERAKYLARETMKFGEKMHSDIRTSINERCKTHGWICRGDRSRASGAVAIWAPAGHRSAQRVQKSTKKERKEAKKRARAEGGTEGQSEAR